VKRALKKGLALVIVLLWVVGGVWLLFRDDPQAGCIGNNTYEARCPR
jgi:hypothetical protein